MITNYGFYLYYYQEDLTDRYDIGILNGEIDPPQPFYQRIIRHYFDEIQPIIVQNDYGFAFLSKINFGTATFQYYIGAMSFYSSSNSKFFKMYKISTNVACKALNQNPLFGSSSEDMITVTLICGS